MRIARTRLARGRSASRRAWHAVLFVADDEPGRVYKLTLDGTILGMFGRSGRTERRFNSIHGIACPSDDVLFIADMNNWMVKKVLLGPVPSPSPTSD